MRYVLDTNAVSALMRGDAATVTRLAAEPRTAVLVPQPVLAEISYGIARLRASKRRRMLEAAFARLALVLPRAPWTDDVSQRFAETKAVLERRGVRLEDFDVAIAAHALALDAVLVSSNLQHMRRVPDLSCEDWAQLSTR